MGVDLTNIQGGIRPIVWSIAGSDSGGGAGIQADNLTIHDLGGHGCTVVTAITAQNSQQVEAITPIQTTMLRAQLDCLLEDIPPAAIKIGMLANTEQIRCICAWLATTLHSYEQANQVQVPVIWDPVMVSTSGQSLTAKNEQAAFQEYLQLAKLATLITPNSHELGVLLELSQLPSNGDHDPLSRLANLFNSNILLTGGDTQKEDATDWLAAKDIPFTSAYHQHQRIGFSSPRVATRHNHGTGCTLSSAIATAMALGYPLLDAIVIAKAYVHQGLTGAYAVGKGPGVLARNGWPNSIEHFAEILLPKYPLLGQRQATNYTKVQHPLCVYPVTHSITILEQVLKGGARTVQLRLKSAGDGSQAEHQIEQDIQRAVMLSRQFQAQVFINDHWQLAIKHGAFGVHLGQEDLLHANLPRIANAGLALGLSSHGYFEMLLAQQLSPSYLAIGHIFSTPTKSMPSQPQGLHKLAKYCTLLGGRLPLVAIGGIDHSNLSAVKATQVDDIAIVRAIEMESDPAKSWQKLQQRWQAQL